MGLMIFLRKRAQINWFRDILIDSINSGAGNRVILCSGFFQEGGKYQASLEKNLARVLHRRSIEITTIGIHNYNWLEKYKNFRNSLLSEGVNITAKYTPNLKWHAKIFILKNNTNPILGIIGSSNITRPAFSDDVPFNYEADIVLWPNENRIIDSMMMRIAGIISNDTDYANELITTDYNPESNNGLSIEDRLNGLNEEIEKLDLRDLPE